MKTCIIQDTVRYTHHEYEYRILVLQVFGSKVRVDSTAKVAELELAEKVR